MQLRKIAAKSAKFLGRSLGKIGSTAKFPFGINNRLFRCIAARFLMKC
jgi:hypothetical protein